MSWAYTSIYSIEEKLMTERMIRANGVEICTEAFGDPSGVPLLLIMGASAQMLYWPEDFVMRFVDRGCYVIRYDNRDTGRSTCFNIAENPYTLDDLVADAVGVMDAYGLDSAHVAGASMGGMITQGLCIHHPGRVRTATLIMSTPLSGGGGETPELSAAELEGPSEAWMAELLAINLRPAGTREQKIQKRIDLFARLAGTAVPFDEARQRLIAEPEVDRAVDLDAMNNHGIAIAMSSPSDRRPLLAEISVPTLVIHGTEDPILPYPHGVALAETIPGAELLTLEKAGHEIPRCFEDEIVEGMLALQNL